MAIDRETRKHIRTAADERAAKAKEEEEMPMKPETRRRKFWAMVVKGDSCWEWGGKCNEAGYGILRVGGRVNVRAHRYSYEIASGPIPVGLMVCHRCDNPKCVRPEHLFLGTASDNMRDCASKGRLHAQKRPERVRGDNNPMRRHPERAARGDRNGMRLRPECVPRGERHVCAKLSNEQATQVRARYRAGGVTQRQLATEFGLTQRAVWGIVHGKSYAA